MNETTLSSQARENWWKWLRVSLLGLSILIVLCLAVLPLASFVVFAYIGAFLGLAALAGFFVPRLWRFSNDTSDQRIRWAFRLYAFRGGLIAIGALAIVLLPLEPLAEAGLQFLILIVPCLFVVIPLTSGVIFYLLWRQPTADVFRKNRVVGGARILTWGCWIVSSILLGAAIEAFQLWPVSLRQGPDTTHAKAGFEYAFGFAPPSSVHQLYFRHFVFWQTSDTHVKFNYGDSAVVERILESLALEPSSRKQTYASVQQHFPDRWLTEEKSLSAPISDYFTDPQLGAKRSAWIDRESKTFYYMDIP